MNNFQPKTLFIGKNTIYLPSCHSTNDVAAEKIQNEKIFDGTLVITSDQTAGRGQRGNTWETMPGQNITMSVILKPDFLSAADQFNLNIAVSLGVHLFLSKYIQAGLTVKWPNDIYVGNRKMGGILIENSLAGSRLSHAIVGIGVNINQLSFSNSKVISLRLATQQDEFDLEALVGELCVCLEKYYLQLRNGHIAEQKKEYLQHLFRFDETHYYTSGQERFAGKIVDVAPNGALMIEVNGAVRTFDFKEVAFEI
ncbi:biotin--[acetyl-CoA-carboxylase] ligase [Emticicia sp. 21SJ11W-3]|uniref:biotin--[acetyl-CoA-carboxylase] ligase n=1 Tax=Emticicia sp. 21SJ11W-3 TaxID=2916755 RepID=UPI00209D3BC0|nr:biotin--[acetyl-CoA-carboxylase] ligase [Emticicia sp. 21SJ11W-3]UTA67017.1 biotin--[acetyl-CoA-carboxylase] ligase [Emticicia sp. 21SJ11W-3]